MLFAMGEMDEYPSWALPLLVRRMYWKDYGIILDALTFEEMLDVMRLNTMEKQREQYEQDKARNSS